MEYLDIEFQYLAEKNVEKRWRNGKCDVTIRIIQSVQTHLNDLKRITRNSDHLSENGE